MLARFAAVLVLTVIALTVAPVAHGGVKGWWAIVVTDMSLGKGTPLHFVFGPFSTEKVCQTGIQAFIKGFTKEGSSITSISSKKCTQTDLEI